jgi:hypothetical protein
VTSVVVTGQTGIVGTSKCEAWIDATMQAGSTYHTPDEHSMLAGACGITCQNIVPGTGFTVVVTADRIGPVIGSFNILWVWL